MKPQFLINLKTELGRKKLRKLIAELGTKSDRAVAKAFGVEKTRINKLRQLRNIKAFRALKKAARRKVFSLFPKASDGELAQRIGVSTGLINEYRRSFNILPRHPDSKRGFLWTENIIKLLGTAPDQQIGDLLGLTRETVLKRRRILGIPSYGRGGPPFTWTDRALQLLGKFSDPTVAKQLRISIDTVRLKRRSLNLPAFQKQTKLDWTKSVLKDLLLKMTTKEFCKTYHMDKNTVRYRKQILRNSGRKV